MCSSCGKGWKLALPHKRTGSRRFSIKSKCFCSVLRPPQMVGVIFCKNFLQKPKFTPSAVAYLWEEKNIFWKTLNFSLSRDLPIGRKNFLLRDRYILPIPWPTSEGSNSRKGGYRHGANQKSLRHITPGAGQIPTAFDPGQRPGASCENSHKFVAE